MRQFGKRYRLQVDDFRFEGLDIRFDIEATRKPSPNNAEITISNLSRSHRKQLQELDEVFVLLEVGWDEGIWQLFQGDLRHVISHKQGDTWETVITSGDGQRAINKARVALSLGPGATIPQIVKAIASSMGAIVEDATAARVEAAAFEASGARDFGEGAAVAGPASDALDELLEGTGLEWSLQAGELRVLPVGEPLPGQVVLLNEGNGLVGSPEPGSKGITEVTCLIRPGIAPARQVRVESEHVNAAYQIDRVQTKGDTKTVDWYHHLELRELGK